MNKTKFAWLLLSRWFQIIFLGLSVLDHVTADTETLGEVFSKVIEAEMLEEEIVELAVGIEGTSRPSGRFQTVSSTP